MIAFPDFNPDIVRFSLWGYPLQIRWYGLMYVLGFIVGYIFYRRNLRYRNITLTKDQYEGLVFSVMLGVILGGRLGYVLFYNLPSYLRNPLEIFAVWQGGMSFHGGALGVIIAGWIFLRKNKLNFYQLADPAMPLVAIGLGFGRLGNFINGELYGRITTVPWAMVFPNSDGQPRHPTQLYELLLEGILLAILTQIIFRKAKREGIGFWSFIGLYGFFRLTVEFVREPDRLESFPHYPFFGWLTMGMILSSIMIFAADIGICYIYRKQAKPARE